MKLVIYTLFAILLIVTCTNGLACQYYAHKPLATCLEGSSISNYFYCNESNFIYWKQYGNGDCTEPAAYDQPLCDPDDTNCVGSCDGDPCDYISTDSYGAPPCNKSEDDFQEITYILDYCNVVNGNPSYSSSKYECTDVGELTYSQFKDESCTNTHYTVKQQVSGLAPTPCAEATVVSNNCDSGSSDTPTTTMDDGVPDYNFDCPHYASTPLNVCVGHYEDISYSDYFFCNDNDELVRKQYGNKDCTDSDNPASTTVLCDSSDNNCYTSCGGEKCDYVIYRAYTTCGDKSGAYNELAYPVGYCVDLTYGASLRYSCNNDGNVVYRGYVGHGCDENRFNPPQIIIELGDTLPGVHESHCLDRFVYATCQTVEISTTNMEEMSTTDMEGMPTVEKSEAVYYCYSIMFIVCLFQFVMFAVL